MTPSRHRGGDSAGTSRNYSHRMLDSGLMGPSFPEFKRPREAEIEQMSQRKMGKAAKRDTPITTDGARVVFQTGLASGIRIVPSVQIEIIYHKSGIEEMDSLSAP